VKTPLLCAALVVVFAGCSTFSVDSDFDESADFASYRSFDWAPTEGMRVAKGYTELTDRRLRNALTEALAAKGIRHSSTKPDLLVAYQTGVQERTEYRDTGWGLSHGGRGYAVGVNRSNIEERRYLEGTLMVDLIDADRNSLAWRGRATGVVGDYENQESRIREAVELIFERYPPKTK